MAYSRADWTAVTIAAGESLSDAGDLQSQRLVGLAVPSNWTAAEITLQGSIDGNAFGNGYDYEGAEIVIHAVANAFILIPPQVADPLNYVKVRSGRLGAEIAQTEEVVLALVHRQS